MTPLRQRMINVMQMPGFFPRTDESYLRYRTMLTLCYGCGLRLSEVLAVRVADIDSS